MPQQGGSPKSQSVSEVEDDVEGQDDPNVDDRPEALQNVVQDLLVLARDILDDLNHLREPPQDFIQRRQQDWARAMMPPGRILMPAGFFGRALVDNFGLRPQPRAIPFWPAGFLRRPIRPPPILRQPVINRLNIVGMVRHRIHRGVIFERPNEAYFIDDVEADQHVAIAGHQRIGGAYQPLIAAAAADQPLAAAAAADQPLAAAAEADQPLAAAAVVYQPLVVSAEADQPLVAAAIVNQKAHVLNFEENQMFSESNESIAIGSEADQQVPSVSETDQQETAGSEADQKVCFENK